MEQERATCHIGDMKIGQILRGSGSDQGRTDRVTFWPAWIPIAATLVVSTAVSFSSIVGILAAMLGVIIVCAWAISVVAVIGLAAWRRQWRRTVSLIAVLVGAGPATAVSLIAGDYLHLLLALPYYEAKIAASGADSKPIDFHWPSAGLIPSYERNLVYDASDELAAHVSKTEPLESEPAASRTVRHLVGHFYLVELFW